MRLLRLVSLVLSLTAISISAWVLWRPAPEPATSLIENVGASMTRGRNDPVHTNVLLDDFAGWGVTLDDGRLTNRTTDEVVCTHERYDACGRFGYTLPAKSSAPLPPGWVRNIRCRREPKLHLARALGLLDGLQRVCR